MPRYIIKLSNSFNNKNYYLEWSTIVDTPLTHGMEIEEFKEYYKNNYGILSFEHELPERLERVEKSGTSSLSSTLEDLIRTNNAGNDGQCLTYEEIIEKYCE